MTDAMNVKNYEKLLKAFENKGYRFGRFDGLGPDYTAVLRHDIDFSLEYALKSAEIEAARGISAYYFILLTSNFYNAFSSQGRKIILRIKALGHELGVHFDPTVYTEIKAGFAQERAVLESVVGPTHITSLHRPGKFLDNNNEAVGECEHTYLDRYFKAVKYISDSNAQFRYGHPLDSEEFKEGKSIQLLIHPIWWMLDKGNMSDKVRYWQSERLSAINDDVIESLAYFDGNAVFGKQT
jgi:hypothetical protein